MDTSVAVFGLQVFLSLVVWGLLAKWFLSPWLHKQPFTQAIFWLTVPHAFRHVGMVFLVPGVVGHELPTSFAYAVAYGDLIAGLLALATLIALRHGWAGATVLAWVFNTVGTVDLMNAMRHAEAVPHLWAAWYIPTFWVPLLLTTHLLIFVRLLKPKTQSDVRDAPGEPG
jgi:hypothetical protein